MSYTPQTISTGDPITANWGNKIEQQLTKLGNYMGEVATQDDLPSSPETGDFYLVQSQAKFYYWNGSKWKTIGGGKVVLAANEDTMTTSSSAWTGLKGFTLLKNSDMQSLSAATVSYVSPSGTGGLRLMLYDYSAQTAVLTGSATTVTSTDPVMIELDPVDVSNITPGAYTVSLQGEASDGSISIITAEFYGE